MNKNTVIDGCLEKISHRFELVILASQRARMLYLGAKPSLEVVGTVSKIDVALSEIAQGLCTRESIIQSFKSSVVLDDDINQSKMDVKDIKSGISYDDFDISDEDIDFNR